MEPERDQHQPQDAWESVPIEFLIKILRYHDLPVSTLLECRSVFPDEVLFLSVPREIDGGNTVIKDKLKCKVVGLVVDQYTKNFKLVFGGVLVATDRHRNLIYESTTGTWSWGIHPFPESMKDVWGTGRSVVCDRCLYWLVRDASRGKIRALLIFDLEEGTWTSLVEKSMEATPFDLQLAAYERHVCLLSSNWSKKNVNEKFDRRSDVANFLRNPMVRTMDGALIKRTRDLYDRDMITRRRYPFNLEEELYEARDDAALWRFLDKWALAYHTVVNFYATGGSDAFFVFDQEDRDLEVVKYWAELDLIFFLPEPPFHSSNRFHYSEYSMIPDDPWCAIIPSPRGSARQGWKKKQEFMD
ncbi:hypothetical protein AXG93_1873s1000 [Marchantia polymorpha subsp. ruderalis]|uniref:F-box associated domain-containing protein n=1 Tax=Marchantia polymorpha subsp. ruderalis TaxID=1480154 RepID=A0A176WLN5_MARPO|nr:hypothetical protein AXG93_1873s1000 [Marchantia polymorpha subsp. ruderalis]